MARKESKTKTKKKTIKNKATKKRQVVKKKKVENERMGLKTRIRTSPKKRIGRLPKLKKVRSRIASSIKVRKIRSKDVIVVFDSFRAIRFNPILD